MRTCLWLYQTFTIRSHYEYNMNKVRLKSLGINLNDNCIHFVKLSSFLHQ